MFAGVDVASERHMLARLDAAGAPIGRPVPVTEDRDGYDASLKALGPPPAPVAMEATGHHWKDLHAVLTAAGHEVALLNPLQAGRFQDASLERTETGGIDARGPARLASEERPTPTRLHDEAAESLRGLVRHRDRLRQDFDDRVRQPHRLVDSGSPESTRYVRGLDSMLATRSPAECPTARDFARASPKRLAKLRHDGRHPVGAESAERPVEAAERGIGQHHGPAHKLQARHICRDLDPWRRRSAEVGRDIDGLLDAHGVGKPPTGIEGVGPRSAARIIAAVGDPARFKSAAAFAAYAGVVPGLKRSGKNAARRAPCAPMGNVRLRRAPWMPVLGAVRRNPWPRASHERPRAAGEPPKSGVPLGTTLALVPLGTTLALVAAMRELLHAVYSVAKNRKPFTIGTEQARAA